MMRARELTLPWDGAPLLMGVLNLNADSFSDPGARTLDGIVAKAAQLVADGAAILDLGAQSAITGRPPVAAEAEAAQIVPVIRELSRSLPGTLLSVDTYKPEVAGAVLDAGAHMVNDVSGLADPELARMCACHGAVLVVMHTSAPPLVRRQDPGLYSDVAAEVADVLTALAAKAVNAGVAAESIVVDPGVDFAKTPAQSIELLRGIDVIVELGYPVLLALSRKDFVGALVRRAPGGRDAGTLGAVTALRHVPRQILRVHDVAATRDAVTVLDALTGSQPIPSDLALPEDLRHER